MTDPTPSQRADKAIEDAKKVLEDIKKGRAEIKRATEDAEATIKIYSTEDKGAKDILKDLDNREKKGRTP